MKLRRISTTSNDDTLDDVFGPQPTAERTNEQRLIDKYGSLENARWEYDRDEYED